MNLFGSRSTLVANACALMVASVIAVEVAYVEHRDLGYLVPSDTLASFIPAIVMLVIRSRVFSYIFLAFYIVISMQLFAVVRDILVGTPKFSKGNDPFFLLLAFTMLSVVCLVVYAIGALIRLGTSLNSSKK